MKKIKLLSVIAPVCLLSMVSLTGCGNGLGSADTDKLDVNVETRGTEIMMWTGFGDAVNKVLQPILDDFSAKTGITVKYETKGGYDNLQNAINLAASSKEYCNIAVGYPDHFAGYIQSNIQLRLDGLIKNDDQRVMAGKDEEGYDVDKDGIRKMNYEDFYADYKIENESLEHKSDGTGHVLGLPFNKSSEVMVYNAGFFNWVKTQDDLKDKIFIPTTWDEVKSVGQEVIKFLNEKNVYGKALYSNGQVYSGAEGDEAPVGATIVFQGKDLASADDFRFLSYDSTPNLFITLIRQFGGTYTELDKNVNLKGYAAFNDKKYREKTLEAMALMRDLGEKKILGIPATFNEKSYCSSPFKKYQSLLNIGSTGGLSNSIGSFAVSCTTIPQVAGSENKYVISQGTNLALFNKGSDAEKVAAWKLMIYLSQQANGEFAAGTGYFPTCKAATESDAYQAYLNNSFGAAEKLTQEAAIINTVKYGSNSWTRFVDPGFQGSSAIRAEATNIPVHVLFPEEGYMTDQQILDAAYVVLRDYVRK